MVGGAGDESDGCLSSSFSSESNTQKLAFAGDSATSGPAAAAAVVSKPANPPAAVKADPSAQLLAAYGYSSRVVKLQNPAAAAAASAAAAAAGARVRGGAYDAAAVDSSQLPLLHDGAADATKRAYEPGGAASNERVCWGFEGLQLTGRSFAPVHNITAAACFDGGTAGKAGAPPEALGLAAAVARIIDAVMRADAAAGVPASGGTEVWGRKVVRLDSVGGVLQVSTQFGSARAA
jgi:hypothetical protein